VVKQFAIDTNILVYALGLEAVSADADAGCTHLLSEDMMDGFIWRGCCVSNPFAAAAHPDIAARLAR
jgi:predicted nucleic acid-binding protein